MFLFFLPAHRLTQARKCTLHKGSKGFGFVLRGAKAASPLMTMIPSEKCPGLQYMDDVDQGGVAERAGVLKGDFLLEVRVIVFFFSLLRFHFRPVKTPLFLLPTSKAFFSLFLSLTVRLCPR